MQDALVLVARAGVGVDAKLRAFIKSRKKGLASRSYEMLEYFLGFRDEKLVPRARAAGKRLRPALALYLGNAYGVRKRVESAALAIELFHNFTLIHDDIVDRDEVRRGRPTVWKLFGTDHAINSGDIQALLASELCVNAEREGGPGLGKALLDAFRKVCEGQYLDFEFARYPLERTTEARYIDMVRKKTGALIGIAAEVSVIAAGKSLAERKHMREFGEALGVAYQIADDYASVWGVEKTTGKHAYGDIREKKRALPVLLAHAALSGAKKFRLAKLYQNAGELDDSAVAEVRELIDEARVEPELRKRVAWYTEKAKREIRSSSLKANTRATLEKAVDGIIRMA